MLSSRLTYQGHYTGVEQDPYGIFSEQLPSSSQSESPLRGTFVISVDQSNADRKRHWSTILESETSSLSSQITKSELPDITKTTGANLDRETDDLLSEAKLPDLQETENSMEYSGAASESLSVCYRCKTSFKRKYDLVQHIQAVRKLSTSFLM
jgi:hypothetical protein